VTTYQKPALTIDEQIALLKSRGLIIDDVSFAKHILSNISYYRLSNYFYNFWEDKNTHQFLPQTNLETIVKIYNFDSELRALCFKAIEAIEISIRAKLSIFFALKYSVYWFIDKNIAEDEQRFARITQDVEVLIRQNKEQFVRAHLDKYYDSSLPSWKLLEISSFGLLSRIYGNVKNSLPQKKALARSLGLPNHLFLESWLKAISNVRNICAHHSRLWDKKLSTIPKKLNIWLGDIDLSKIYINLCCIKFCSITLSQIMVLVKSWRV
jgi:abortive infection bacteriophage resistance protein